MTSWAADYLRDASQFRAASAEFGTRIADIRSELARLSRAQADARGN